MSSSTPNPTLILGSSYALYLAYKVYLNNGVFGLYKDVIQSDIYHAYLNTVKRHQETLGLAYHPMCVDGKTRRHLPDASTPRIFKKPSTKLSEVRILQPVQVRGLTLRNRIIRGAAFDGAEGWQITKTHEDVAAGGTGLTVVAYCSVSADGRTFDGQIVLREVEDAKQRLGPVVAAVHKHGGAIAAQLTHAGSFAERSVIKQQQVSASAVFNISGPDFPRAATREDIDRLVADFASGAVTAVRDIGFDAVELHCGHGYLLSQWMSPKHNIRTDEFGGSALNRVRFPVMVLRAVRKAVGEHVPILVKMNVTDGIYSGLELPDALVMAEEFANNGADILVVTCGNVSQNSLFMLRGPSNIDKLALALPGASMKLLTAVFGPFVVPETPFETCFLRYEARAVLERVRGKVHVCLMGGVDSLGEMEGAMDEGFGFCQVIRPLIREPDLVQRIHRELAAASPDDETFDVESKCIRCNQCVTNSVDPDKEFGCPFRNMEVARSNKLSISPAMARAMLPDIEDGLAQHKGKL